MKKQISKSFYVISIFLIMIFSNITSAFAVDEVVTNDVTKEKGIFRWFFWPGWAFGGIVISVIALMSYYYWKNVLGPKKRGRKIS